MLARAAGSKFYNLRFLNTLELRNSWEWLFQGVALVSLVHQLVNLLHADGHCIESTLLYVGSGSAGLRWELLDHGEPPAGTLARCLIGRVVRLYLRPRA